jgi:hypothetical protein
MAMTGLRAGLAMAGTAVVLGTMSADRAAADQGGVSFWLPGQFASLAAVPGVPGWGIAFLYYHSSVSAGRNRQFDIGGRIQAGLDADANLGLVQPSYTFATPVLGGQLTVALAAAIGNMSAGVQATLTGPNGNTISGSRTDERTGFSDLYPLAMLKWNDGVNNYMVYTMWGIPVGTYDSKRLANLGIGHWSADFGGGYTYFNPQTGWEFSAVIGFTYNFENPSTRYQNGIDAHLDWGISRFLSKQFFIGAAGYFYNQLTGDSGAGATLGDFKSRVAGVGPQLGYLFPVGDMQGIFSVRSYWEFAAQNRPEGWNVFVVFALTPAAHPTPPASTRLVRK